MKPCIEIETEESIFDFIIVKEIREEMERYVIAVTKTKEKKPAQERFISERKVAMEEGKRMTGESLNLKENRVRVYSSGVLIFESGLIQGYKIKNKL